MTSQARLGALTGVVSAGAGLGASEVVSGALHQRVSPVVAVAECVIRLTPGAIAEKIISIVGHNDKPLAIISTLAGLLVVSAIVGVVAMRSLAAGELAFVVMGVILLLAVHARLTSSEATYLPAGVGVALAMVVLATLAPRAVKASRVGEPAPQAERGSSVLQSDDRRDFLRLAGVLALGAVVAGGVGRVLAHSRAALEAARRKLSLPVTRPVEPAGVSLGIPGIAAWNTSAANFYRIDTALSIPEILPNDWSLRIHGMVDKELTLTFDDLVARGVTEYWLTLCCVSNEVGGDLISNAWFSGVKIADILAEVGVHSDADAVKSTSDDGWTAGTPIGALTDNRDAIFAVAMNGQPLEPEHGFPVRMVVPGLYGYVSGTKWIRDFEVTRFSDFSAFWTDRGWSEQGPIKTESRIDVPNNSDHVKSGKVAIGGVAWAQHTGIAKVEVHIDDGDWVEAELGKNATVDSWRQWAYVWAAEQGTHQIQVRATDESGYTQTSKLADVIPNGATGWHTISVVVD